MRRYFFLSLLIVLLISNRSGAQSLDVARLDTLFNRLEGHHRAIGSILLSKNGKVIYERGFSSQIAPPNTTETVYRIGSVTKMFTAAMVFRLIEENKLRLDDTLGKWFPQLPNAGKITIDQLLSHHSGLRNITEDTSFMSWQETPRTRTEVLARIAAQATDFAPGEKGEYSNTNFILLGYIIEEVTGRSYADNLSQRLTGPLKLGKTAFDGGGTQSYAIEGGQWVAFPPSSARIAGGAGGIVSTVGDMARFIEALFLRRYISEEHLKQMMTLKDGYGRGMVRFPFYDRFGYGHNGRIDNFNTSLAFFPKDSLVLSIVTNGLNYNFNNILIGVLSTCYGRPYSVPEFGKALTLSPGQLKRLEGVYTAKSIGMDLTVTATEAGLTAQALGQGAFPLEARSETSFSNEEVGVRLDFSLEDGAAAPGSLMLSQGGAKVPFIRKP